MITAQSHGKVGGGGAEKGGRDISCFAWDTGPDRRCSAWGTFTGGVTAATVFLVNSVAVKRNFLEVVWYNVGESIPYHEQHSLCVEAVDV